MTGSVVDAARQPAAGAAVSFHFHASAGVPWLRSTTDDVAVVRGVTDSAGRFTLEVPAGVAGTCLAEGAAAGALATACVSGRVVQLQLAPVRTRTFSVRSDGRLPPLALRFEGATPLAAIALAAANDTVVVPQWSGLGGVLLCPPGFARRDSGTPWVGVAGCARDRLFLAPAPSRGDAVRWCAPLDAGVARVGEAAGWWGNEKLTWIGQLADGTPFAARGEMVVRGPRADAHAIELDGCDTAVVAARVVLALTPDEDVSFTIAEPLARAGERWCLPAWVTAPAAALLLGRDRSGWRVLARSGENAPAFMLRGSVRGEAGAAAAGAVLRVRPVHCRPGASYHAFFGLEVVSDAGGAFTLPVRLCDGAHEWIAAARDGRVAWGQITIAGADHELSVTLPSGGEISGLVLDGDGEPIAGLAVDLRAGRTEVPSSFGWPEHRTFTSHDGEFVLRGLEAEQAYELTCSSVAWGDATVDGVRAGDTGVSLQLRPPAAPR